MTENAGCFQYLFPLFAELRQSRNAPNKIMELFQFVTYFGRRGQDVLYDGEKPVVRDGARESWFGILWKSLSCNFCISCQ
jgi:hypothetical protein